MSTHSSYNMWDKKKYILELKKVAVFQRKTSILSAIDLQIRPAEFIYVLGPTGVGKSSFLKTLYGELTINEGQGRILDFELGQLDSLSLSALRRNLGIVAQEYPLLEHRTVEENLMMILRATDWTDAELCNKRIDELLNLLKIGDKRQLKPSELTKSDRQRALIARALLNRPSILILDESTAELDESSANDIHSFLHSYAATTGTTVLYATNNENLTKNTKGRVLKLEGGKANIISA